MINDYNEPEDFLSDESFINWYFKNNQADCSKWDTWIADYPGKKNLVNEAVELLNSIRLEEINISGAKLEEAHAKLILAISQKQISSKPAVVRKMSRRWLLAAASVAVIFISLFLWKNVLNTNTDFKTQYGEIKQQLLPDGSQVILNANSNISYSKTWEKGKSREVWVKGEAFFQVQKTVEKSKFIVHTDKFDIVVTGTQFNVINKANKVSVLLKEGSITVLTKDGRTIKMQPGEFYEYVKEDIVKKEVKTEYILAWKDNKIDFDNATLNDAVKIIKEHYGVDVKLESPSLGDMPLNGIIANDNLDVLLKAIEEVLEVQVIKNNGEIVIKP